MNRRKTGIVGGGASGLMAAVAAAERGGEEIFVLEKKERIGKKILATGNGRCNLTNLSFEMDRLEEYYHGASARQLSEKKRSSCSPYRSQAVVRRF